MTSLFEHAESTAEKLGACEPAWLKEGKEPEFYAVEEGTSGPEIFLLHGLLGAFSNWEATMPEMAKFARPIALHFPILTAHRSEVKVKALAAFTEFYIRKRGVERAILCGNSLGGHVALRLCLAVPELVDCLILSGSSGLYEHSVDALPVRPDRKYLKEHMARVFYNERFITDERVEEIYKVICKRMNTLNLIHAARSAKKDNLLKELKNIQVPTLLLWGENDNITTMEVADIFHSEIPNSELVTVKNCGHAPMIEYPEWFAEQTQKFLEKNSKVYRDSR